MPQPSPPILPDPLPLREVLRGLRHALRRGGETLAETLPLSSMPRPAALLAEGVMRTGEEIARGVDDVASRVVRKVLPTTKLPAPTLAAIAARGDAASGDFAAVCYGALSVILQALHVREAFISEAAAQQAWARVAGRDAGGEGMEARAAELLLLMLEMRVLRDIEPGSDSPGRDDVPVLALFALLLWLQSERAEAEDEAALLSALDLTKALSADVLRAASVRNAARLGQLMAEFARHV